MKNQNQHPDPASNLDAYIESSIQASTHRHLSEVSSETINHSFRLVALKGMRRRIDEVFSGAESVDITTFSWANRPLDELESDYMNTVRQIPTTNSFIDPTKLLRAYMYVDTRRLSDEVKEDIRSTHDTNSIPISFVELMEDFEQKLGVQGHEAASLALRHMANHANLISDGAANYSNKHRSTIEFAGRIAFKKFVEEVKAGQNHAIDPLPLREGELSGIEMSISDSIGLIEAYHIYDRPYSLEELKLSERLLRENASIRKSLLAFQLTLVEHFSSIVHECPHILQQSLEPYNPVMVPMVGHSKSEPMFAPNPKLVKTMCNTWIPSIARVMMADELNTGIAKINTSQLSSEQIALGILNAPSYSLFASAIGEFKKTDDENIIKLVGSFRSACPARNTFTNAEEALLGRIYDHIGMK